MNDRQEALFPFYRFSLHMNNRQHFIDTQFAFCTILPMLLCLLLTGCGISSAVSRAEEDTAAASEALAASALAEGLEDLSEETLAAAAAAITPAANSHASLSVLTDYQKFGDIWFLVDCYHNQVLYSEDGQAPLADWLVLTADTTYPHTISSDGTIYLITDTDANRVLIFQKSDGVFVHTQTFENVGIRPHYSIYREEDDTFYVWSSMTGEMYLYQRDDTDNRMYLTEVRTADSLSNNYIRSFCIEGDSIYFVSGMTTDGSTETASILQCRLRDFAVEAEFPVPDEIAGMACMKKIEGNWYLTVSTDLYGSQDAATILRTDDLSNLGSGNWEDLYETYFAGGGTPYAITSVDDFWYLTEHRLTDHALWQFQVQGGEISDVKAIY